MPYEQSSELVPMSEYGNDTTYFRVLDCWQCFQAAGRMCHRSDYVHNITETKKSIDGYGICCKPDATDEECAMPYNQS